MRKKFPLQLKFHIWHWVVDCFCALSRTLSRTLLNSITWVERTAIAFSQIQSIRLKSIICSFDNFLRRPHSTRPHSLTSLQLICHHVIVRLPYRHVASETMVCFIYIPHRQNPLARHFKREYYLQIRMHDAEVNRGLAGIKFLRSYRIFSPGIQFEMIFSCWGEHEVDACILLFVSCTCSSLVCTQWWMANGKC